MKRDCPMFAADKKKWDEERSHFWDSAVKGNSAQNAGILRRLLDEVAVLSGDCSAGIYFDIEKFYDSINLPRLIELSTRRGFSLFIAAMDLQVHAGLRVLSWAGCHSEPINISTSVLAGSKFSNT